MSEQQWIHLRWEAPEPQAGPAEQNERDDMGAALESVLKVTAVAALVAYLVGIVVVTIYLRTLEADVPDLLDFKPRFILTGAAAMVGLGATALTWAAVAWVWRDAGWPWFIALPVTAGVLAMPVSVAYWMLSAAHRHGPFEEHTTPAYDVAWLAVAATGVVFLAVATATLLRAPDPSAGSRRRSRRFAQAFFAVATVVATVVFLWQFALRAYPVMPPQFGGSRVSAVELVLSDEGVYEAGGLGITVIGSGSHLSETVGLIFQGDDYLVLRTHAATTAELSRSLVVGMRRDEAPPRSRGGEVVGEDKEPDTLERGGGLVLRASERIAPETLSHGWHGGQMSVDVAIRPRPTQPHIADVEVFRGDRRLPFGHVVLGSLTPWAGMAMVRAKLSQPSTTATMIRFVELPEWFPVMTVPQVWWRANHALQDAAQHPVLCGQACSPSAADAQ